MSNESEESTVLPEGVANGIEKYVRSAINEHINTKNESGEYKIVAQTIDNGATYGLIVMVTLVNDSEV